MTMDLSTWVGQAIANERYRILRKLGAGGMGFVFLAQDQNVQREVVVKVPRPNLLADPAFAGRFLREVSSMVKLSHPHIVKVMDVGEHEQIPYMVLEYLQGGSLKDRQTRIDRSQRLQDLVNWLPGVAQALDFMHRQDYIHRDVKLDNILFDAAGHVFLSDFGIAKAVGNNEHPSQATVMTGTGMVLGTPQYMAPEQVLAQTIDGRTDQYSLAVSVYQYLSEQFPFDGTNPMSILMEKTQREAPPLATKMPMLPDDLSAVVQTGMLRNPQNRFNNCQAFAKAVDAAVHQVPALVPSNSPQLLDQPTLPEPAPPEEKRTCPKCKKPFRLAGTSLGKVVRCPNCQTKLKIPGKPAGIRPVLPETSPLTRDNTPQGVPSIAVSEPPIRGTVVSGPIRSGPSVGVIVLIGALIGLLVGIPILLFILFSGVFLPKEDNPDETRIEQPVTPAEKKLAAEKKQLAKEYHELVQLIRDKGTPKPFYDKHVPKRLVDWRKGAKAGLAYAQLFYGSCLMRGIGEKKDEKLAYEWFRKAAQQNNAAAQNNLGYHFQHGKVVAKDEEQARTWYQKAADQGFIMGQRNLGFCFERGIGGPKDFDKAFAWYKKAADKGYVMAFTSMGHCYANGFGVTRNDTEAFRWFTKAAEKGDPDGEYWLGHCYYNAIGTTRNDDKAAVWFEKAANQGHARAQWNTGYLYLTGISVTKDLKTGFAWYMKAAKQNYVPSYNSVGWCYQYGKGVNTDVAEAVTWYRKGAENGEKFAQYHLGQCYNSGIGLAKDTKLAFGWYMKAAKQDHIGAQTQVGFYYLQGIGTPKDEYEAVKWSRKGAEKGNAAAQNNLGVCYARGIGGLKKDEKEAFGWYLKSALNNDPVGQYNVARNYEYGLGVKANINEALRWYRASAAGGYSRAKDAVARLEKKSTA